MISTEKKYTSDDVTPKEKISLLTGDQVITAIQDEHFLTQWDELYQKCSWSTVFQNPNFVTHWYQIYRDEFEPIMVTYYKGQNLAGLLTMAISSQKEGTSKKNYRGKIIGAGHYEAEYQSWLSTPEENDEFIHQALTLINRDFPNCHIFFRYLIPEVPLGWIDTYPKWRKKTVMQAYKRPIMRMDDPEISKLFRKKEFRNKYNRLKRFGDLSFKKISDQEEFSQVLPILIEQFEFRQMAMFNKCQFTDSPEKLEFLMALFEQGLLHATILKVDDEIVASILGLMEKTGTTWVLSIPTLPFMVTIPLDLFTLFFLENYYPKTAKTYLTLLPVEMPTRNEWQQIMTMSLKCALQEANFLIKNNG
ncbi:GNAT family N-acetyltransferase [Echinicola jeungdonensis]|uniref:GNAT family N-acetyltransferase n=1 Tax=Echinicola jeungdonensis TaxID=709343 RepID=UPI0025B612F7|nr:GNAT family N-acetyltransferase [Echinicola jeungdonensis]MDN3671158.1 GNAT family N-acetyltransferase [Echinicola jeungdonensis]